MRATWMADVLRAEGLDVWESPGWKGRGRELASIHGVVAHHTASSTRTSDTAVHALLRDGRKDLAGPLSQLGLERDGTWVVIADGRANHNGYGEWGNDSIGVEAYNDGVGEPWSPEQLLSYKRGVAAILRRLELSANEVRGHKETDPRRKIDPAGIDMARFRLDVGLLHRKPTTPAPPQLSEEDDMLRFYISGPTYGVRLCESDGTTLIETGVKDIKDVRPGITVVPATEAEVAKIRAGYATAIIK